MLQGTAFGLLVSEGLAGVIEAGRPVITGLEGGVAVIGSSVAVSLLGGPPAGAVQWQIDGADIPGATAQTLNVPAADGAALRVLVDGLPSAAVPVRHPLPVATGALPDLQLTAATGLQTRDLAPGFSFAGTPRFTLLTAPLGVSLDTESGVLSVDTALAAVQTATPIAVELADAGDPTRAAETSFTLTLSEAAAPALDLALARITTGASGLTAPTADTQTDAQGVAWTLAPDGTLSGRGARYAGLGQGVGFPVTFGTFQTSGGAVALTGTVTGTQPSLTPDAGDLSAWTKSDAGMAVTSLGDATRIASNGQSYHFVSSAEFAVAPGEDHLITLQWREGTSGAAVTLRVRDPATGAQSKYERDAAGTVSQQFTLGALRVVAEAERDATHTLLLRFVPNRAGGLILRVGPNSTVAGAHIDVVHAGVALRRRIAAVPALFENPAAQPMNADWGDIASWANFSMSARTDLTAEADPFQMPQRLTADASWKAVLTEIEIVAGRRYTVSVVWRGIDAPDRIRTAVEIGSTITRYVMTDAGTVATNETLGAIEGVRFEAQGTLRRLAWEFVATQSGTAEFKIGPNTQSGSESIEVFRAGIAEDAGARVWDGLIGTGTFAEAWRDAGAAGIVQQNYVDDSVLTIAANADGTPEMAIDIPAGAYSFEPSPAGGIGFYDRFRGAAGGDTEGLLAYDVRLDAAFDYDLGGKLPGLMHGRGNSGLATDPSEGWSARYMWGPSGVPYLYVYDTDRSGDPGDAVNFFGGILVPGRWHSLAQRVRLNTPGQADGEIEVWMDGVQVALIPGLDLRADATQTIEGILFDIFRGGGTADWAADTDGTVTIRNIAYWAREVAGQTVAVPAAFGPADWTALDDIGGITVTVAALPDDANSTITDLEISLDGGASWAPAGATGGFAVPGLADGTYAVALRARNAVGPGPVSDIKPVTLGAWTGPDILAAGDGAVTLAASTGTAPPAPAAPTIVATGDGAVTLDAA
ncbi:MAG: polysaccharide lyase [Pseudomonadota bacterium]